MKRSRNRKRLNFNMLILNVVPIILTWLFAGDLIPYIAILVLPIYLTYVNFKLANLKGKTNFMSHYFPGALSLLSSNLLGYMNWVVADSQITLELGIVLYILLEIMLSFISLTALSMFAHMFQSNQQEKEPQQRYPHNH